MSETPTLPTAADIQARLLRGPYHQWLGLEVQAVREGEVELTARWREEWVVNAEKRYTHGGILAALVDLTADWALVSQTGRGVPTIDLRVDYLRPGIGSHFELRAEVLRLGSRVATTRMEFFGPDGVLMSAAAAAYIVS